jgi:hypothetical protein
MGSPDIKPSSGPLLTRGQFLQAAIGVPLALVFGLTACGGKKGDGGTPEATPPLPEIGLKEELREMIKSSIKIQQSSAEYERDGERFTGSVLELSPKEDPVLLLLSIASNTSSDLAGRKIIGVLDFPTIIADLQLARIDPDNPTSRHALVLSDDPFQFIRFGLLEPDPNDSVNTLITLLPNDDSSIENLKYELSLSLASQSLSTQYLQLSRTEEGVQDYTRQHLDPDDNLVFQGYKPVMNYSWEPGTGKRTGSLLYYLERDELTISAGE